MYCVQEAWYAFHIDKVLVNKYMTALRVGRVKESSECGLIVKKKVGAHYHINR